MKVKNGMFKKGLALMMAVMVGISGMSLGSFAVAEGSEPGASEQPPAAQQTTTPAAQQITTPAAQQIAPTYNLAISADDNYVLYVDGTNVVTDAQSSMWTKVHNYNIASLKDNSVVAVAVTNTGGPTGLRAEWGTSGSSSDMYYYVGSGEIGDNWTKSNYVMKDSEWKKVKSGTAGGWNSSKWLRETATPWVKPVNEETKTYYYRTGTPVEGTTSTTAATESKLTIAADDSYVLYLDGKNKGNKAGGAWSGATEYTMDGLSADTLIAVKSTDLGTVTGLKIAYKYGESSTGGTDENWYCYVIDKGTPETDAEPATDSNGKKWYEAGYKADLTKWTKVNTDATHSTWNKDDWYSSGKGWVGPKTFTSTSGNPNYINIYYRNIQPVDAEAVTVTYHQNYDNKDQKKYSATKDADYIILDNGFGDRVDYTFKGWNTQADGLGKSYSAADIVQKIDADLNLYAQWAEEQKDSTGGTTSVGGGGTYDNTPTTTTTTTEIVTNPTINEAVTPVPPATTVKEEKPVVEEFMDEEDEVNTVDKVDKVEKTKRLPQTGMPVDGNMLMAVGALTTLAGAMIFRRKND